MILATASFLLSWKVTILFSFCVFFLLHLFSFASFFFYIFFLLRLFYSENIGKCDGLWLWENKFLTYICTYKWIYPIMDILFKYFIASRTWYSLTLRHLCITGHLLHVCTNISDQKTDGQMGYGVIYVLLYCIYWSPILSPFWHFDPRSHHFRSGCRPNVECQVYLSISGEYLRYLLAH